MKHNKLTIITTIHNGEAYIEQCVKSILNQTLQDFEYLIINDGSTDDTKTILDNLNNPKIRIIHTQRIGRAKALNLALSEVKTEFVANQDIDDISYSDRLETQFKFLQNHQNVVWCGSYYLHKNSIRNEEYVVATPQSHTKIINAMSHSIPWAHTLIMFKKSAILKVGGYSDFQSMLDFRLALKLAQEGYKLANVNKVLGIHHAYQNSYWFKNHNYYKRMTILSMLQKEAISSLNLPKWKYIYVLGRMIYAFLPTSIKKIVRVKIIGRNESINHKIDEFS